MNTWTVMIYMAGDNTLAGESIWALTEILTADLTEGVEVIALFDTSPPEIPNRRFVFTKSTNQPILPVGLPLEKIGKKYEPQIDVSKTQMTSTGTAQVKKKETLKSASDHRLLQRFVEDCIKEHPAEKYLLVLSGHGSGAVGDFLTSERPAGSLSIPDLNKALKEIKKKLKGKKIDILGMDSCLMSMAEVAYELRDSVGLLVGSEGFAPETGWPYRQILSALNGDAMSVATAVVDRYIGYYRNFASAGLSVDQAVCELTKLDPLTAAIGELAEKMTKYLSDEKVQDAIILAHLKAQSYKSEQYTDLWDFCDWLERKCPEPTIRTKCAKVRAEIDKVVGGNADYYGPAFQHSHGLSVFFPWKDSGSLQDYCKKSAFAKKSGWGEFLLKYVEATQAERRGESRDGRREFNPKVLEPVEISATESPLVIPVLSDFPVDSRQPPGSDKQPPGSDKGLSKQGAMKNPPRYFLRNIKDKKAAR